MKTTTRLLSLALLTSLLFAWVPPMPAKSAQQASMMPVTDAFGNLLNPGAPFHWIDIAQSGVGSPLSFNDDDNAVSESRSIGFPFPFYEVTYSQLRISIDGVLYLGSSAPPDIINIRPFPFESRPNAVIAPLWADLALVLDSTHTDGEIWYKLAGETPNKTYTVQWNNVYRLGSGVPITFQVILKESGDIVFNYKILDEIIAGIPIGIEDSDGIDGVQYHYEVSDLVSESSVYITRPGPGARMKAFPVYQGDFMDMQSAVFYVTVRNTGTVSDTYTISDEFMDGNPDWGIQFLDGENPITSTDLIAPGDERSIKVAVNSSSVPIAGDYARVKVNFQSTQDAGKQFSIQIQAAVPSEFTKVHVESVFQSPHTSILFRSQASKEKLPVRSQDPNNLAILRVGGGKYLLASDTEVSIDSTSYIKYTLIKGPQDDDFATHTLVQDSQTPGEIVRDLAPAMAITPDGNIGIVFIRERLIQEEIAPNKYRSLLNSNIWFAAVTSQRVHGPYQITQNDSYGTQQTAGIDFYTSPTIAATADNRFTLVWVRNKTVSGDRLSDLYMTNLSMDDIENNGASINPPLGLTNGQLNNQRYYDPVVTSLKGGGSALISSVYKTNLKEFNFYIYYLDNYGMITSQIPMERTMQGVRPDILQLRNSNILIGYTTPDNSGIGYALVTPAKTVHRCELPMPSGDTFDYVSITTDPAGNGILTWADRLTSKHYYTLISPNPPAGANDCMLLTPPMMYGQWAVSETERSHYNQHSTTAPLGSPNLFIPLIGQ